MQKQGLLIVFIIFGFLVAMDIVTRKESDPVLREMLNVQSELLHSQKAIEEKLSSNLNQNQMGSQNFSEILRKQQDLEQRLTSLETQIKPILTAVADARNQQRQQLPGPPSDEYTKVYQVDVAQSTVKGNKNAKVTIVEFSDFQCPFSHKFHPLINDVLKVYPKDVNFILKNFPLSFHPNSRPAAKAALAAGEQGKYWEMVELLFENYDKLGEDKYKELAKQLGLNVDRFMKDYKDKDAQWEQNIQADESLADRVTVRGTPTFFINGRKTQARDLESWKQAVDQILNGQQQK